MKESRDWYLECALKGAPNRVFNENRWICTLSGSIDCGFYSNKKIIPDHDIEIDGVILKKDRVYGICNLTKNALKEIKKNDS